jgi:hypothetical protein
LSRIDRNGNCHAGIIHLSSGITLPPDLGHVVEIFEIAYGTSWKLRRWSSIQNGKVVELYLPKTSEMRYMLSIASQKRRNGIGPRHFSLR